MERSHKVLVLGINQNAWLIPVIFRPGSNFASQQAQSCGHRIVSRIFGASPCVSLEPTRAPERSAEAVRRALPELIKLHPYEASHVRKRQCYTSVMCKAKAARLRSEKSVG